jgi:signal transduction histidine kinase
VSHSNDILADFAHRLRQPLSALDALAFYLSLIATPEDAAVHEQLQRMQAEIARADQVVREGLSTLRACYLSEDCSVPATEPKVTSCPRSVADL